MKKILIYLAAVVLLFTWAGIASADWATEAKITVGFKGINAGTFLDLTTDDLLVGVTTPVIDWDRTLSLDLGLASDLQKRPIPLGSISVDIQNLAAKVGADYKLLDPLRIGGWYGRRVESWHVEEKHYGIYGTLRYEW